MSEITRRISLPLPPDQAFQKFVHELNQWWPREYTWSQERLQDIRIDAQIDGLCTEIGPYGFRCDWGRVTEITKSRSLTMKWQISSKREPVPDPDQASEIMVRFVEKEHGTILNFTHHQFEKHGEDGETYREMMDSEYGWDYILSRFTTFCNS